MPTRPGTPAMGLRFFAVVDATDAMRETARTLGATLITVRDLAAVATPAPYVRVASDAVDVDEYERIVDGLAARGPVLPAPPGAVLRSQATVTRWLEVHYAALHAALGAVESRTGVAPYELVRMELGA